MTSFLLDANHLGLAVTRSTAIRRRLERERKAGSRFGTCVPVLCEIEVGVRQVAYPDVYRQNLKRLLNHVRIWPIDWETAVLYGEIYHDLRLRGRVLSQVDMMLAALAKQ